ncbi:hypothetical protein CPB84DRAFT_764037 [Gymnopilus junonius]|uniref:Uncharacterized protein n=1 Tax=Gymnopilus junonius TaxID=109634 RepID=A0A9P5NZU3_GYMJU|nr:hypothetical protein CPB84DRAFT_764037 [Gymnopilus junonius]
MSEVSVTDHPSAQWSEDACSKSTSQRQSLSPCSTSRNPTPLNSPAPLSRGLWIMQILGRKLVSLFLAARKKRSDKVIFCLSLPPNKTLYCYDLFAMALLVHKHEEKYCLLSWDSFWFGGTIMSILESYLDCQMVPRHGHGKFSYTLLHLVTLIHLIFRTVILVDQRKFACHPVLKHRYIL